MSKLPTLALRAAALAVLTFAAFSSANAAGSFRAVHGASVKSVGAPPSLAGTDLIVTLTGVDSFDELDSPLNTYKTYDLGAGKLVDGISWNLTLSTFGESWLSEATVLITNADGDGVVFNAGFGDDLPGTATYADGASLVDLGLSFSTAADGKLYLQFFEDFDDVTGAVDATYTSGTLTFNGLVTAVPEASTYAMMAFGLLGLGAAARRRGK